ncbi:MAG: glycosyltransferase family 2 protein [Phycisphaerae bacterium]
MAAAPQQYDSPAMPVVVVIPALNEQESIARVVASIPSWVQRTIVVDNGSTDATAERARQAGAEVITEPRRGYGQACLAGCAAAEDADIVVFLDGDLSDYPDQMEKLVQPITEDRADFVLGSRTRGVCEAGALLPQQRFGGWLACLLIRWLWRYRYTDLGPFRAIRRTSLTRLNMDDQNFGWTVQMQIRAVLANLRIMEIPLDYRRRIGRSKISGTLRGVFAAGTKILYTIAREQIIARRRILP